MSNFRTKMLVSAALTGLGDRIDNLLLTIHISKSFNIPYSLDWVPNPACGAEFHHIFDNQIDKFSLQQLLHGRVDLNQTVAVLTQHAQFNSELLNMVDTIIFSGWPLLHFTHLEKIRAAYEIFKTLKINGYIIQSANNYTDLSNHVGVHFRRGDVLEAYLSNPLSTIGQRYIDEKTLFYHIDNSPSYADRPIFLSSEDIEGVNLFVKRYGNRICSYPCRSFSRQSPEGVQDAMINIVLLSRCGAVLCGGTSRFIRMVKLLNENVVITKISKM